MLKPAEKLNERELEPRFQATLRGLVARVPFLKLVSLKQDVKLGKDRIGRPDWLAELRAGEQSWTLVAEGKKSGQPREVRTAVLQLKHYLSLLPPDKPSHGLVLAPFISEESARICAEAGVGYADFAGNARLSFDRIFIETRAAGNPPGVKREARSVFSPKGHTGASGAAARTAAGMEGEGVGGGGGREPRSRECGAAAAFGPGMGGGGRGGLADHQTGRASGRMGGGG